MPISSSSLFHFTSKLDSIKKILTTGFRVTCCDEIEYEDNGEVKSRKAIPMVCFCDIPISLVANHAELYCGSKNSIFGFGMNKEWAIKKNLNPILYLSPNSEFSKTLVKLIDDKRARLEKLHGLESLLRQKNYMDQDINNILNLLKEPGSSEILLEQRAIGGGAILRSKFRLELFTKPTVGKYERNETNPDNHNFYNEREWRYIPEKLNKISYWDPSNKRSNSSDFNNAVTALKDIIIPKSKDDYEDLLEKKEPYGPNLTFDNNDLSFIIVDTQKSVSDLIEFILNKKFLSIGGLSNISENDKPNLISKIISWKQISNDILGH